MFWNTLELVLLPAHTERFNVSSMQDFPITAYNAHGLFSSVQFAVCSALDIGFFVVFFVCKLLLFVIGFGCI